MIHCDEEESKRRELISISLKTHYDNRPTKVVECSHIKIINLLQFSCKNGQGLVLKIREEKLASVLYLHLSSESWLKVQEGLAPARFDRFILSHVRVGPKPSMGVDLLSYNNKVNSRGCER